MSKVICRCQVLENSKFVDFRIKNKVVARGYLKRKYGEDSVRPVCSVSASECQQIHYENKFTKLV